MYPGFTNKKVEKVSKAVANHVQPKLKTGSPGDIYEQEADAVAKTVLNMPGTGKENHFENGIEATKSNQLQQPEKYVQQKPAGNKNNHLSIKQSELDLSKYSAQPISSTFQKKIEPRFGYDFSGIKIHTGEKAIQMSRSLNAHAFTYGNHIFFNKGKYNPETGAGQQLLAHELTHTIQQRSVPEKSASSLTVSCTSSKMVQGGFFWQCLVGNKKGSRYYRIWNIREYKAQLERFKKRRCIIVELTNKIFNIGMAYFKTRRQRYSWNFRMDVDWN